MSRAARFEQPVIAVKEVKFPPDSEKKSYMIVHVPFQSTDSEKKSYMIVHVSFQSTGSTNITTINALDQVELYVNQRERGRGGEKQIWAIEMN